MCSVQLENDLSGSLSLEIFLWVKYGSGRDCICQLEIAPKPEFTSLSGMKIRETELGGQGIRLVWHPKIHFELQGTCSIKLGKADFAIQDVEICPSTEVRSVNVVIASRNETYYPFRLVRRESRSAGIYFGERSRQARLPWRLCLVQMPSSGR